VAAASTAVVAVLEGAGDFHGGGFGLGGGGGFHGAAGGYEAHNFGGVGVSHSVHDVHRNWGRGWYGYGGGYACDSYLAEPPYCPTYTY
jgi:hypothetical protein